MPIPAADPNAQDLDAAFAAAMQGPAKPRSEPKTPPEVDHDAPFGRADDGTPKAPYGYKPDGSIKRSAGGRPPKDDPERPRTGKVVPPADAKAQVKLQASDDFTEGLIGAADGIWLCMTAASKLPLSRLGIGKYRIPESIPQRIGAQAHLFDQSKGQLVVALNEAAKHNARAHAIAAKLSEGDATWVLTVASMAGPFVAGSIALWKGDERLDVAAMAAANEAQMDAVMEALSAQAKAIQEQAMTAQQLPFEPEPEQPVNGHVAAMAG